MDSPNDDNSSTEIVNGIFDKQGRNYYLKIHRFNYSDSQKINIFLMRSEREDRVGHAYCSLKFPDSMELQAIIIYDDVDFGRIQNKFFKLTHWNEPTDYQRKGLGSYLLKFIISLAKKQGVKKIYGSLVNKDIKANQNLINWYEKHGFKLEIPTSEEIKEAKYRICLYLN